VRMNQSINPNQLPDRARVGVRQHLCAFLRRAGPSSKGQGLVEFALVLPLVLFLFFGVFEFGRFFYTRLTLQHAVAEATRFAVTGNVLPDTLGNPMSRAQSIIGVIRRNAQTLDVDVDRVTINPSDAGGPGDVVTITADFTFQFMVPGYTAMFPDGQLEFRVSTAMKNEPFIIGQSP
jgi:Flp pilus assembly protein TadG